MIDRHGLPRQLPGLARSAGTTLDRLSTFRTPDRRLHTPDLSPSTTDD